MEKTNKGLVDYAKKALAEKWGYVWGTFGKLLTADLLAKKIQQYPDGVENYQDFIKSHWLGKKTSDCVGLIKSYIWFNGTDVMYDGKFDVSADGMYEKAKEKGPISTIPDIPGICVWKNGHIGVYIGNGQVIEAHGTLYGVIQTPLHGNGSTPWTQWLKCPDIEYEVVEAKTEVNHVNHLSEIQDLCNKLKIKDKRGNTIVVNGKPGISTSEAIAKLPLLKIGSSGEAVKYIQKRLGAKVDGVFGPLTQAAVRAFQIKCKFAYGDVDGIVGQDSWGKLAE